MQPHDPGYFRAKIVESIEELEHQLEAGEIELHTYFIKKRALVKMF